ncbi:hypothetical protein EPI10_031835 [Gossypium australe]|uniref:Uncharacterized protein n=1 Tax=Gossypium australe TaxID=47621 RepID=A0A5B6X447_9ROSI|nr:hypothetical protein EPI10_031835 [Gossypium australe]
MWSVVGTSINKSSKGSINWRLVRQTRHVDESVMRGNANKSNQIEAKYDIIHNPTPITRGVMTTQNLGGEGTKEVPPIKEPKTLILLDPMHFINLHYHLGHPNSRK